MLSSSFDNIPENNFGERIKALEKEIRVQLTSLSFQAARTAREHEKAVEWFNEKLAQIIQKKPDRSRFELEVAMMETPYFNIKFLPSSPFTEHSDLFLELKNFMRGLPRRTLFNLLTGGLELQQETFLHELQDKGEELIEKAQQRNLEKKATDQLSQEQRRDAFQAREFYNAFSSAIETGSALLAMDALIKFRGYPSPIVNHLLTKPVNGHPSALLAFASLAGKDFNTEQLIVRFLDCIPSRAFATSLLENAIAQAKDENMAAKLEKYKGALALAEFPKGKIGREFASQAARDDSFDISRMMRIADSSVSLRERFEAQDFSGDIEPGGGNFGGGAMAGWGNTSPDTHQTSAGGDSGGGSSGGGGGSICDVSCDPALDAALKHAASHNPFKLTLH